MRLQLDDVQHTIQALRVLLDVTVKKANAMGLSAEQSIFERPTAREDNSYSNFGEVVSMLTADSNLILPFHDRVP